MFAVSGPINSHANYDDRREREGGRRPAVLGDERPVGRGGRELGADVGVDDGAANGEEQQLGLRGETASATAGS